MTSGVDAGRVSILIAGSKAHRPCCRLDWPAHWATSQHTPAGRASVSQGGRERTPAGKDQDEVCESTYDHAWYLTGGTHTDLIAYRVSALRFLSIHMCNAGSDNGAGAAGQHSDMPLRCHVWQHSSPVNSCPFQIRCGGRDTCWLKGHNLQPLERMHCPW